jgi:hypothetical protein
MLRVIGASEVATDLGKGPARTNDAVPRHRGGAHAATKTSRFRKTEPAGLTPPSAAAPDRLSGTVPWPREAAALSARRPRQTQEHPQTQDLACSTAPAETEGHARAAAARSTAAGLCAVAIVATVIPLVVLQIPDAIAWSLPPRLAGGPAVVASLLRASGLAQPAMAVAGSLAALAVRWLRAGPVLLAGLLVLAAADMLGDAARTVALIGVDRSLHGAGAGIAMAGVVAIAAERRSPRRSEQGRPTLGRPEQGRPKRGQPGAGPPDTGRRLLAGWWAAFTVAGLATAPELMRHRVSSGGWHAALQPCPWLTGIGLVLGALYAMLAEGTAGTTARNVFPAAERAQLALLTAPVAGICAIAVAVTYRGDKAVVAAAIADAIALAAITARAGTAARFAVVCAVTGFTLAPAAGAVTALTEPAQPTAGTGVAVLVAALCGAALAVATRRPHARAATAIGLSVAAVGLAALDLAGLAAPSGRLLAVLCVPLAGGLAAALTASLHATGAAGALAGLVILVVALVAGYLAAGAMQLRALTGARTVPAAHAALVTAAGHWALVTAAITGAVALALACTSARQRGARPGGRHDHTSGVAPVPGAGGTLDHG